MIPPSDIILVYIMYIYIYINQGFQNYNMWSITSKMINTYIYIYKYRQHIITLLFNALFTLGGQYRGHFIYIGIKTPFVRDHYHLAVYIVIFLIDVLQWYPCNQYYDMSEQVNHLDGYHQNSYFMVLVISQLKYGIFR